jgi:methionine synthase I (cobalamin-dependent)
LRAEFDWHKQIDGIKKLIQMTRRDIIDRFLAGDVLVHDGAGAWSAPTNLDAPDILRAIHEDYLRAGADIITANNYCTGPSFLDRNGKGAPPCKWT